MTSRFAAGAGGAAARPRIRVAVVGLGWAGRSIWLPRLTGHPDYEVAAVVDPDPAVRDSAVEASAGTGTPGGGPRPLADVSELSPGMVDLAVVAVPNHLHSAVACQLLAGGIPVFLEKPVCLNSAEADQLAAAEDAGGAVLLAGSAARYRADVRALRNLVGSLGRIRHVDLSWVRARGIPDAGGWFTRRQLAGGGALVDLGWHLLDTVGPLLGPVAFEQVVGTTSDDFVSNGSHGASWRLDAPGDDKRGDAGDVEDTARGFLVTSDGVSFSLQASWASHEAKDVTLIKVAGSEGTATLQCTFGFSPNRRGGSRLTLTHDGESVPVAVPEEAIGTEYDRQLDEIPLLLGDPASRGKAIEDARRTIAVIERFYASARSARSRRRTAPAEPAVPAGR